MLKSSIRQKKTALNSLSKSGKHMRVRRFPRGSWKLGSSDINLELNETLKSLCMSSPFLTRLQERRPYKDHSLKELQWKHSAGHNSDKLKNEGLQTGWKYSDLFRKLEHLHVPGYLQHRLSDLKSPEPQWEVERRRRLFREAELVEKHLKEGYQQEALLLHTSLKTLKHQYLIQHKDLELRLSEAELERDWAKQQSLAAYSEHEVLLQEHHALLRELRKVRERLEQEEAWYGHDEPVPDRTNWRGVQQGPWWYR